MTLLGHQIEAKIGTNNKWRRAVVTKIDEDNKWCNVYCDLTKIEIKHVSINNIRLINHIFSNDIEWELPDD